MGTPYSKTYIDVDIRFVPFGAFAPNPVRKDELWLDVGNRLAPRVFDHHGDDSNEASASALVLKKHRDFLLGQFPGGDRVTIVLHEKPDLDAVCAAWLAGFILDYGHLPEDRSGIESVVDAVSKNDQGFVQTDDPFRCWPIVMRTLLQQAGKDGSNDAIVRAGVAALDRTKAVLNAGGELPDAARELLKENPETEALLKEAEKTYEKDLACGEIIEAQLPLCSSETEDNGKTSKDALRPVDGLILRNPESVLFKELARGDTRNSPCRQGFILLVVVYTHEEEPDGGKRTRYIISTSPDSGFHLKGLGPALEEAEQQKENELQLSLPEDRKRVGEGKGRHGYNVQSPWYDGRGHEYTIVDSPAVTIGGKVICGSVLSLQDILKAIEICFGGECSLFGRDWRTFL